jgi:DNA-binding NarL/FixJ family response regulator
LIQKLGPYEIISEYDDGEALLEDYPFKVNPDLLILDLSLPGMNGDALMQELNKKGAGFPVLVLTLNRDEDTIVKLFRNGVRGYLPKDCTAASLRAGIEDILNTGYFHNEFLSMSLRRDADADTRPGQREAIEKLTARELEFIGLVCNENEYTYEQIADKMGVQQRTVDGYRESIFKKLGVKSKTGLVLFVLKHRLFDLLDLN